LRNVALLMGGAGLGAAFVVACSPVLSRLYDPKAFGALAVFMSLASVMTSVGSWRYEFAILLSDETTIAANVLALCFAIVAVMGSAVSFFTLVAASSIANWLNCVELAPYLWLLPVAFFGGGAYQILGAWALRHEAYKEIARTRVSQSCGMVCTQLALGAAGVGPVGLVAGDTLGRITGVGVLARFGLRTFPWGAVSLEGMLAVSRRYVKFPLFSYFASLLTALATQLPDYCWSTSSAQPSAGCLP
jgi:O-antigen/teichoic acid export membrane protein